MNELARVQRLQVLADLGEALLASLDRDETNERLARTVLDHALADLCAITLSGEPPHEPARETRAFGADAALAAAVEGAPERIPRLGCVLDAGCPVLVAPRSAGRAGDGIEYAAWEELDGRAAAWTALHVPLPARGRVLGALTLVSVGARAYGPADVALAEEVARRAGLAIDNACIHTRAKEAARLRDTVLGVVAHDLRDPLSVVLLQAQRARATLDVVQRNALWMTRLVRDLLDVARLDGGVIPVERAPVPADGLLAEVVEALRPAAAEAAVTLYADGDRGLPPAWGDRDRLLQVLCNLVANALDFTPRGGRVVVGARRSDAGGVLFSVADSGVGIAPEDLPRVFDRFWQSRGPGGRGVGLGLSIAKSLVEAHGGSLRVDSTPGRGSTFWFTIPAPPRGALDRDVARSA